jgi:hypothetical protein
MTIHQTRPMFSTDIKNIMAPQPRKIPQFANGIIYTDKEVATPNIPPYAMFYGKENKLCVCNAYPNPPVFIAPDNSRFVTAESNWRLGKGSNLLCLSIFRTDFSSLDLETKEGLYVHIPESHKSLISMLPNGLDKYLLSYSIIFNKIDSNAWFCRYINTSAFSNSNNTTVD